MKLKEALRGKLTAYELGLLRASFDVVGDIAIIEIPPLLEKKEKVIGSTLLGLLKNVNVVLAKQGSHYGKYRRQRMKVIAGEDRKTAEHKENGVSMRLNVETCYFSPRLSTERMRIAGKVKKGEKVLVVGSGVAPYPLVIARNSDVGKVVGVEFNPSAHKFAVENVALNKLQNKVDCIKADAANFNGRKFDRVIVPIPHEGVEFVRFVFNNIKPGGYLHILDFAPEFDLKLPAKRLKELCGVYRKKCRLLRVVKAGQHAVRSYRVCLDVKVY